VMKLLNRLTTIPMRRPAALSWPRVIDGFNVISSFTSSALTGACQRP
jgi:hypothetical protein